MTAPALPDGLVAIVKRDCPTCRLVAPVLVVVSFVLRQPPGNFASILAKQPRNSLPYWLLRCGGSFAEAASDLRRDATGRYAFGGFSFSPDLPVSQNTLNGVSARGGLNGFVAVIDPAAPPLNSLVYSSYITGPGSQIVNGVDIDATGAVYVTGSATSNT